MSLILLRNQLERQYKHDLDALERQKQALRFWYEAQIQTLRSLSLSVDVELEDDEEPVIDEDLPPPDQPSSTGVSESEVLPERRVIHPSTVNSMDNNHEIPTPGRVVSSIDSEPALPPEESPIDPIPVDAPTEDDPVYQAALNLDTPFTAGNLTSVLNQTGVRIDRGRTVLQLGRLVRMGVLTRLAVTIPNQGQVTYYQRADLPTPIRTGVAELRGQRRSETQRPPEQDQVVLARPRRRVRR